MHVITVASVVYFLAAKARAGEAVPVVVKANVKVAVELPLV